MKKILMLGFIVFSIACTKTETPAPTTPANTTPAAIIVTKTDGVEIKTDFSKQKKLAEATFKSGAHTTTGNATVYEDAAGVRTLVFENFKTDAGPDLRIYLSSDLKATSFTEISKKVENGSTMYTIPTALDLKKQANVIIWCKSFSVLFGSASF
jgi:Electron transfer DM13